MCLTKNQISADLTDLPTIKKGSETFASVGNQVVTINVTFDSPMHDANYVVSVTRTSTGAMWANVYYAVTNKTINGFELNAFHVGSGTATNLTVDWIAID